MSNLDEYTKNMDVNNFREIYMKYKKILRNLKKAQMKAMINHGFNEKDAETLLDGIHRGRYTSHGYEHSPETDEIGESLQNFFDEYPKFNKQIGKIYKFIANKVKKERTNLSKEELNSAIDAAVTDFYKYNGPTIKNRSNKNAVLDELKLMPPEGIYPGGEDYRAAKRRFNGYTRNNNRNYNGHGGTRKKKY